MLLEHPAPCEPLVDRGPADGERVADAAGNVLGDRVGGVRFEPELVAVDPAHARSLRPPARRVSHLDLTPAPQPGLGRLAAVRARHVRGAGRDRGAEQLDVPLGWVARSQVGVLPAREQREGGAASVLQPGGLRR